MRRGARGLQWSNPPTSFALSVIPCLWDMWYCDVGDRVAFSVVASSRVDFGGRATCPLHFGLCFLRDAEPVLCVIHEHHGVSK